MISTRSTKSRSTRNSRAYQGVSKNVIVDSVPVDQQQNAAVPVSQPSEAAHAHECVIAVVGDVKATHTAQNVGQRAVSVFLDFVRGNHADRGEHIVHSLGVHDAPSSVTVITADEIQEYGYRTLADILQSVRGFYVTYDRDYSFVGVRGFGRLGDWNSRVLVLIDGHRTNNNVLGQAMLGREFLVDVDLIERVEIIRGPSSSLYGDGAFFAVINVITRKAPQLKGLEVSFAPASFGTYQGRASYGRQYKAVDMLLSGTFYDSQGQTLFFPEFDGPATSHGITSNTDYENSQHILATLSFRGFTLQGLFSARDKGVPTAYFGTAFSDPRTRNLDYHQYLDLSYQHAVGEKWELSARTSYDQSRLQAPLAFLTGLPEPSSTVDAFSFRGNWWDGEIKLSRTFLEKHTITLGSEVTDNLRQDRETTLPSVTSSVQTRPVR